MTGSQDVFKLVIGVFETPYTHDLDRWIPRINTASYRLHFQGWLILHQANAKHAAIPNIYRIGNTPMEYSKSAACSNLEPSGDAAWAT